MTESRTFRVDPPRELTVRERELLVYLLSRPFPGRDDLLRQAESAHVWGECTCGCSTIDLMVPGRVEGLAPAGRHIAAEAFNDDSEAPVEVLLHTVNGVLREMEVVWYGDDAKRNLDRVTPVALTLRR